MKKIFKNHCMIDSKDLMIGNIFWDDYGGYYVVKSIGCNKVGLFDNHVCAHHINNTALGCYDCDKIEGVKLTPELLSNIEGCKNLDAEYCDAFRLEPLCIEFIPDGSISVRIELEANGRAFVLYYDRGEYYLHQLQNLLKLLSNKDLIIKL